MCFLGRYLINDMCVFFFLFILKLCYILGFMINVFVFILNNIIVKDVLKSIFGYFFY